MTDLSVIVPLYNEEESIDLLYESISGTLRTLDLEYEILFVDDGSRDATFAKAEILAARDPRLRVIKFRRNYGQTPAMAAGIDHSRGRILLTMDGDLQNDPADIPEFITKIDEGYDIVVGWRHNRQDHLVSRKIPSRIANWIIGKVTGVPIRDNGCSLKAYRADVVKSIPLYSEMHRFIPAMTSLAGARIAEIKVRHHARRFGVSKYGLSRIYKVLLDLLTIKTIVSFVSRPMVWFSALALLPLTVGMLLILAGLYRWLDGADGIPMTIAGSGVLFVAGSIFLMLGGAIGELVYKTGNIRLNRLSALTQQIFDDREPTMQRKERSAHE